MNLYDKIVKLIEKQIFFRYLFINIILFMGLVALLLGKLILKESNPFFYTNF